MLFSLSRSSFSRSSPLFKKGSSSVRLSVCRRKIDDRPKRLTVKQRSIWASNDTAHEFVSQEVNNTDLLIDNYRFNRLLPRAERSMRQLKVTEVGSSISRQYFKGTKGVHCTTSERANPSSRLSEHQSIYRIDSIGTNIKISASTS